MVLELYPSKIVEIWAAVSCKPGKVCGALARSKYGGLQRRPSVISPVEFSQGKTRVPNLKEVIVEFSRVVMFFVLRIRNLLISGLQKRCWLAELDKSYDEKPDYEYLRKIFRRLFISQQFKYDNVFDWTEKRFYEIHGHANTPPPFPTEPQS
jgi:hypothetical protein